MSRRSALTCCMYHQACRRRSPLAASSSASRRRLPRVGARISTSGISTPGTLRLMSTDPLFDGHGRRISDLRVSVTDRCNFRCQYCMPAEGLPWLERADVLSFEEIERLVSILAPMGVTDLRLTGGEPLVRREFPRLVAMLARVPGVEDLSLTTNGYLLERDADALVDAGITRVNVSIDSLQKDRFFQITRRDSLPQVLRGLEAIARHERIWPIKVNAVALRDFTEEEAIPFAEFARSTSFQVRFIEFMPLDGDHAWSKDQVLTGEELREIIHRVHPLEETAARAARHRARIPLRRRPGRDRLHQPRLRALLRRLQPHPADCRRQAAHLPVLPARDRPARAAAGRRLRRRAGVDHPRGGLAQGAEAPSWGARVPAAAADDVRDRWLALGACAFRRYGARRAEGAQAAPRRPRCRRSTAVERIADELAEDADARPAGGFLIRRLEPVEQVVGRIELAGPGRPARRGRRARRRVERGVHRAAAPHARRAARLARSPFDALRRVLA